jgi:superfamily II DNA helicase RecQ
VPAYVVFHDSTLAAIAELRPASRADLADVPGIGPAKLERYGDDVLAALAGIPAAA